MGKMRGYNREDFEDMAGILKGLAIVGGTGLAVFVVLSRPKQRLQLHGTADFEQRLRAQESDLRAIRVDVDEADRRIGAQMEFVERRMREIKEEIPSVVEARLNSHMAEMQARLESQIERRYLDSVARLEQTIDQKLSDRISSLERTLLEQSLSIGTLRERAETTEQNLQRLITAVERLCERAQPAPASTFQAELDHAMRNPNPETFVPRFAREAEATEKKSRAPLARTLVALLTFGISRLIR